MAKKPSTKKAAPKKKPAKKNEIEIVKKKNGRPRIYQEEMNDLARKFCLLGATNAKLGEFFGVPEKTIESWLRTYPGFLGACQEGREKADAEIANSLFHRAKGYTHKAVKIFCNPTTGKQEIIEYEEHYPPDTRAAQYWLCNRQRRSGNWSDTQRREITGADGAPLFEDKEAANERARKAQAALLAELDK